MICWPYSLLMLGVTLPSPVVPIVPRLPTPTPTHTSVADAPKKKRKRGKPTEGSEEGEIPQLTQQPLAKKLRVTRAQ